MDMQGSIHIGTSGWHYDHWVGPFYREDTAPDDRLAFYAARLPTVEINNSFYQLPERETFVLWRDTVPEHFVFAVKASRYITHMKKLKRGVKTPLKNLLERARLLEDRLGPVLFQLPPKWHCNHERLAAFLDILPPDYRYTIEFRDPDWFNERTYELLHSHNVAFCIYELDGRISPKEVTADFVYVRLHGPDGAYQGHYNTATLSGWAGAFASWQRQGHEIFCYFDNDEAGYAADNALTLHAMLDQDSNTSA